MLPSICRMVVYTLTEKDAAAINRRRTTGESIAQRIQNGCKALKNLRLGDPIESWPIGAQAHIGEVAQEGEEFPMVIVRTSGNLVNGQVMLDGTDVFWVREIAMGPGPGSWKWPSRVDDVIKRAGSDSDSISDRLPSRPNCF